MSKRGFFLRYSLIIQKIQKNPSSFEEINGYLEKQSELKDYVLKFSIRQFQRDLNDIRDLFNIDIQYNRGKKVYSIEDASNSNVMTQMLENFYMYNAMNTSEDLTKLIHFDRKPSRGGEFFYGLIHAIKSCLTVKFSYYKYEENVVVNYQIEPYVIKEFKGRWYLIGKEREGIIKTFGLDRITDLAVTKKKFQSPKAFDSKSHFKNYFGIYSSSENKLHEIVLSFDPLQGKYIKSFPLHESQSVILDNNTETRIRLQVYLTYDFLMELMSFGNRVKVISPDILKKELCRNFVEALDSYKKNTD